MRPATFASALRGARAAALACALALSAPAGGGLRAQWIGDPASEALTRAGIDHIYNLELDSARTGSTG